MGGVGSKVCESIASCANAFDSFLPEQKPHDGGEMREKVKKDNKTLKAENEALMLKLVRVEKEKAAALQKLEKRLARKEKLERLEAAESLEEKERIRTATIQVIRTNGDSSSAVVLVSASTGLPVAESLAQHVEHLLNATAQECTLFDEDGNQVPSDHLVEQCLLPRATTMTYPAVRKLATTMVAPAGIPVLVALCKEVASITHLSLAGAGLGDSGMVTLATALSHAKPSLVTLDLSNNAMGVDGSRAIARCLPDLASLETLVVHDNLIGIESAKSLAESIAGIKTLEWVTVTEQLALPVGALKRNDLTTLDLGRQKMGSADAIILASLLRQNTSLEVLELAYNKIKAEGAKAIAAALTPSTEQPCNTSLTSLNLIGNTVGPEGAKALAEALKPNAAGAYCGLHTLNLAVNNIQDEGCVALSLALAPHPTGVNTALDTLVLWGNNIELNGAKALADALTLADQEQFSLDLSCNALGNVSKSMFPEQVRVKFLDQPLMVGNKAIAMAPGMMPYTAPLAT